MGDVRRVDFEQAISAKTIAEVAISPDGERIAYVLTEASQAEPAPVMSIWIIDADGGTPRRLTTSDGIDTNPRWSPDGTRVAFLSDRKERGKLQLYLLSLAGGEAVRITDHAGGVADPAWSPDGTKLAFTGADTESDEDKKRKEERNDHKIADADWRRSSLYVIDAPADAATLTSLPEPKRLTPEGMNIGGNFGGGYSWAPDSAGFVAVAAPTPKAHDQFSPDLITLDLDGNITNLGNFEGLLTRPYFSPDGSTIGFIACEDKTPSFFSLRTIPATGGESSVVLPKHRASFHDFRWLPDGDRMLAVTEEGQQNHLRIVDPEARTSTSALDGLPVGGGGSFFGAAASLSADGQTLAFAWATDHAYGDLYVAKLGGAPKKLTDLNPWVRDHDWGEVREISWTSTDGMRIEGLLILPVGYQEGQRYPLLLQIHGGPCAAWTRHLFANWHDWGQFMAQRGYAVLLPNPRGSSGQGSDFLCAIVNCYGEPDWDDLMTGVDYVIEQGIADPERMVVGGWSGGGFLTNWTITHTDRFKAAVSGAGIANWVSFQGTADVRSVFDGYLGRVDEDTEHHWRLSPIRYIKNAVTPTLILYGENDLRVPVSQGFELYEGLKSRGVETQLVMYPREPHGIGERKHQLDLLVRVTSWFDRHIGKA